MLNELISIPILRDLAGASAFQRGEAYFSSGAVAQCVAGPDRIDATVSGTAIHRVALYEEAGRLAYECTCPRAAEGYFCKHCVAVGMARLDETIAAVPLGRAGAPRKRRSDPWQTIRNYLSTLASEQLAGMILDLARRDDRLYQSLVLKSERNSGGADLVNVMRKAIDHATRIRGFVDWREAREFADRLDQVADSLEELLDSDTVDALVGLAEYAIESGERALEQIDDSGGAMGEIIFEEHASLDNFKKLKTVASKVGSWPEQRERALARLADITNQEAI
jgi:uncharacterized Zn finger protein